MNFGKLYIVDEKLRSNVEKEFNINQENKPIVKYLYYCSQGIFHVDKDRVTQYKVKKSSVTKHKQARFLFDLNTFEEYGKSTTLPPNGIHVKQSIYVHEIHKLDFVIEEEVYMTQFPKVETNIDYYIRCRESDVNSCIEQFLHYFDK